MPFGRLGVRLPGVAVLVVRLVLLLDSLVSGVGVVGASVDAAVVPPVREVPVAVTRVREVPVIAQEANLSCEAASLQMVLAAVGVQVSQPEILEAVGSDRRPPVVEGGRVVRWGDPHRTFVGDVRGHEYDHTGYGVYAEPIAAAAERFGAEVVAAGTVEPGRLYQLVGAGHPAVVWVPFDGWAYRQSGPLVTYRAWDGREVVYGPGFEHAVAVAGVEGDAVVVNNPRWGFRSVLSRGEFEALYAVFGDMAVVVG